MNIALFHEMTTEAARCRLGLVCDGRCWSDAEMLGKLLRREVKKLFED